MEKICIFNIKVHFICIKMPYFDSLLSFSVVIYSSAEAVDIVVDNYF